MTESPTDKRLAELDEMINASDRLTKAGSKVIEAEAALTEAIGQRKAALAEAIQQRDIAREECDAIYAKYKLPGVS